MSPFFREAGTPGQPAVLLLHSSASSSGQWRLLMEQLAPHFHLIAPDLQGCGKSAPWHFERPLCLDDEVDALAAVIERAGPRFHLVGHSFGGAVALRLALRYPERLASLALYEPVLFSVLKSAAPQSAGWQEVDAIATQTTALLDAGEVEGATARFVNYWMGDGHFERQPEARRPALVAGMPAVKGHWQALFNEPTPLQTWASLPCPCLLMSGDASRLSALGVAAQLETVLPHLRRERFGGIAHMGPVTHPAAINAVIADFLRRS
jgi:pimeloyl-ACP methyl ester carboxylesterase